MSQLERITITLKAGASHDAPWIVIHGDTVDEAGQLLAQVRQQGVLGAVRAAASEFQAPTDTSQAIANLAQGGLNPQQTQNQSQAQQGSYGGSQELPQQYQQSCQHGAMSYVANGRYGPFWACPLDRNDPRKCKAVSAR